MIKSIRSLIAIAVASTAIFFQCAPTGDEIEYPVTHFDVRGFLNQQIEILDSLNPGIEKSLRFQSDTSRVSANDIDWATELEMFYELDINKPALVPLYDSIEGDALIYRLIEPSDKAQVKELKIAKNDSGKVVMLGGSLLRNNYLYRTERKLLMKFDSETERLISYQIISNTKVILKGDENGEVNGVIRY